MNFNEHWELRDRHAFLSPSQYHWVNYTPEKLQERFFNDQAKKRGIELHDFASTAIRLKRKLPKNRDTVNMFVNDALGYNMVSEQPLYYSDNCFGTADAVGFNKNVLRIHDLKTGSVQASMTQLLVYAALFCLEYGHNPDGIDIELRIYQSNEVVSYIPEMGEVQSLMDLIVDFDKQLQMMQAL